MPNHDASCVAQARADIESYSQERNFAANLEIKECKPNREENMKGDGAVEGGGDENEDQDEDADDLKETLGDLLSSAFTNSTGGSFAASGLLSDAPNPGLDVIGLGGLGLPLSEGDAQRLASFSEQAPFGKGAETLVDLNVRKTWQIDASKIRFNNPEWKTYFKTNLVPEACRSLGIPPADVKANLYKLLLYTPGGHFEKHQDTEKEPGMFGTLIIVLPSPYLGGAFEATHPSDRSKTKIFDPAPTSDFKMTYIALYTDVYHKIYPITMGNRLALSFNLVYRTTPGIERPLPRSVVQLPGQAKLFDCLKAWAKRIERGDDAPEFIAHILDHKYSQMALSFKMLKGEDRVKVGWLMDLAQEVGLRMQLAHLELIVTDVDVSEDDDDDEERDREYYSVKDVVNIDGTTVKPTFWIDESALCPAVDLTDRSPDKTKCEDRYGNEGGDVTHWYRQTILILWPTAGCPTSTGAGAVVDPKRPVTQVACQLLNRAIDRFSSASEGEQALYRDQVLRAVEATPKEQMSAPALARAAITLAQEDVFRKTVEEMPTSQVLANLPKKLWIEASERFGNEYVRQLLDKVFRGVGLKEPFDKDSSLSRAWSVLNTLEKKASSLGHGEWVNNRRLELVVRSQSPSAGTISAILALCKTVDFERCRPMLELVFEGIVIPFLERKEISSTDHKFLAPIHTFIRDLPVTFTHDGAKAWCRERTAGLLQHIRTLDKQFLPLVLTICSQTSFDKLQPGLDPLVSELERKDASSSASTSYTYHKASEVDKLNKFASGVISKVLALHPTDATAVAWAEDHSLKLSLSSLIKDFTQEHANRIVTLVKQRGFSSSRSLLDHVFRTIVQDVAKGYSTSYHGYNYNYDNGRDSSKLDVAYNLLLEISTTFSSDNGAQVWTNEQLAKLLLQKKGWDVKDVPTLITVAKKLTYPAAEKLILADLYQKHRRSSAAYDAFWRALGIQLFASSVIDSSRVSPFIHSLNTDLASRVTKDSIRSTDYMGRSTTTNCQPVLDVLDLYLRAGDSNDLQEFVLKFAPTNEPELASISGPLVSALRPFLAARGLSFLQTPWAPLLKATLRTASSFYDPKTPPASPPSRALQAIGEPELDQFLRSPVEHTLRFRGHASIRKKLESRLGSLNKSREITMETFKTYTPHTLVVKKVGTGQPQRLTGPLDKTTIDSWQKAVDECQKSKTSHGTSAPSDCPTCNAISACISWSKGQPVNQGLIVDVGGIDVADAILKGPTANVSSASSTSLAASGSPQGSNVNPLKRKRELEGVDLGAIELD